MEKDSKPATGATPEAAPLFDDSASKPAPGRTFGLRAFDAFLYPGVTNVGVFAVSVFFTYLTNRGEHFGRDGSSARWIGENIFKKRGEWMKQSFMSAGLGEESANNAKMVFWSFIDGSLLSPFVKWFENDRTNIARSIDKLAGTEPDDDSVYTAEPKQTWGSILGGRLVTAIPVVLTAVQLDKAGANGKSFNQKLFYEPGIQLGNWFAKTNPKIAAKFSKETFHELSKVTLFEVFYTSVCTTGLYVASRAIASFTDRRDKTPSMPSLAAPESSHSPPSLHLSSLMLAPPAHARETEPHTELAHGERHHDGSLHARDHGIGAAAAH